MKKLIQYGGRIYSVQELARFLDCSVTTIHLRIKEGKLTLFVDDGLADDTVVVNTVELSHGYTIREVVINGVVKTHRQVAEELGVSERTVHNLILKNELATRYRINMRSYTMVTQLSDEFRFCERGRFGIVSTNNSIAELLPTSIDDFYQAIVTEYKELQGRRDILLTGKLTLVFKADDRNQYVRTVTLANTCEEFVATIDTLTNNTETGVDEHGSDNKTSLVGTVLDFGFFAIKHDPIRHSGGSASVRKDCKVVKKTWCRAISFPSTIGHNNCLFAIIKSVLGLSHSHNDIRKNFTTLSPYTLVGVNDLPEIENALDIKFYVYDSEGEVIYNDLSKIDKTHIIQLLLQDNHYNLITDIFPIEERLRKRVDTKRVRASKAKVSDVKMKPILKVFFDCETVFNPLNFDYLSCYSVSYKYNDKTEFLLGDNCLSQFIQALIPLSADYKICLIGFNSSRFDMFLVAAQLCREDLLTDIQFGGNSILNITTKGGWCCQDLARFIPNTLAGACKAFNIPASKGSFPHDLAQEQAERGNLYQWLKTTDWGVKLEEYNKLDVICLEMLYNTLDQALDTLIGKRLITMVNEQQYNIHLTISQMCYNHFKERTKYNNVSLPENYEKMARTAMHGGRVQCFFGRSEVVGDMRMGDVTSLYPYVMSERSYPIGPPNPTTKYVHNKLGIYNVTIISQDTDMVTERDELDMCSKIPTFIPNRNGDSTNYEDRGSFDTCLTNIEIETLRSVDYVVEVRDGFYFQESVDDLFSSYIDPFIEEKKRQDRLKAINDPDANSGIRELCKLGMNSLSGKLMQRAFDTAKVFTHVNKVNTVTEQFIEPSINMLTNDRCIVTGKLKDVPDCKYPTHLGVFVYAYARSYMFCNIFSKYPVYYTDTDSIVVSNDTFAKLEAGGFMGESLGKIKDDLTKDQATPFIFNRFIAIAKKEYCIIKDNVLVKSRVKGVRDSDNYILGFIPKTRDDKRIEVNMSLLNFDRLSTVERFPINTIDFFERRLRSEPMTVVSWSFKKNTSNLTLQYVTITKELH